MFGNGCPAMPFLTERSMFPNRFLQANMTFGWACSIPERNSQPFDSLFKDVVPMVGMTWATFPLNLVERVTPKTRSAKIASHPKDLEPCGIKSKGPRTHSSRIGKSHG